MLKRNDKYHSIADDVPIPKMYFFNQNRSMVFFKNCTFVSDTIFVFVSDLAKSSFHSQAGFFKSHWIVDTEGTISNTNINTQ